MFYTFDQNNSGGWFDHQPDAGISHYVIVEADSAGEANERAREIGLYFDGRGDCSCCGDRWYEQDDERDGTAAPSIYGEPLVEATATVNAWMAPEPELYVHVKDGRKFAFHIENDHFVHRGSLPLELELK